MPRKALPALPDIVVPVWSCCGKPGASVSPDAQHNDAPQPLTAGTISKAWRLCNCQPSATQEQRHKALSNGLQAGAAAPAWSQEHLRGLPGGPLQSPWSTLRQPEPAGRGEAPGRDAKGLRCCRDGFSFCSPHSSHLSDLPGFLPGQSGGWGAYPNT